MIKSNAQRRRDKTIKSVREKRSLCSDYFFNKYFKKNEKIIPLELIKYTELSEKQLRKLNKVVLSNVENIKNLTLYHDMSCMQDILWKYKNNDSIYYIVFNVDLSPIMVDKAYSYLIENKLNPNIICNQILNDHILQDSRFIEYFKDEEDITIQENRIIDLLKSQPLPDWFIQRHLDTLTCTAKTTMILQKYQDIRPFINYIVNNQKRLQCEPKIIIPFNYVNHIFSILKEDSLYSNNKKTEWYKLYKNSIVSLTDYVEWYKFIESYYYYYGYDEKFIDFLFDRLNCYELIYYKDKMK